MKYLIFCLLFLSFHSLSTAQTTTTSEIYDLEVNLSETSTIKNQKRTTILKISNPNRFQQGNLIFGLTLKKAIKAGKLTIYTDENCKKALPKSKLDEFLIKSSMDTIITFDPNTFEEQVKIVEIKEQIFPNENTAYGLTQNWNFNKKTQQLNMTVENIHVYNTAKVNLHLFSIKNGSNQAISSTKELNNSNIILAKKIDYTLTFDDDKLRKALLSKKHLNAHKIISATDRRTIFPKNELIEITQGDEVIDTIITFNSETFEESVKIVKYKNDFDAEHITRFRVSQEFYFDAATNTIKSRILAIAPMKKYYDENQNFMFEAVMFWIVYEDDFMDNLGNE